MIELELGMLIFEGEKLENLGEKPSKQGRESTSNSTRMMQSPGIKPTPATVVRGNAQCSHRYTTHASRSKKNEK
jgi:hypothetical protein